MRIYMEADYAAMSKRAANIIAAEVIKKPDCVLGLATGPRQRRKLTHLIKNVSVHSMMN